MFKKLIYKFYFLAFLLSMVFLFTGYLVSGGLESSHLLFGAALFFLISLIIFFKQVVRPINKLSYVMEKARGGNYGTRFVPKGNDEIARLGSAFNEMLGMIDNKIVLLADSEKGLQEKLTHLKTLVSERTQKLQEEIRSRKEAEADLKTNRAKDIFLEKMKSPLSGIIESSNIILKSELSDDARSSLNKVSGTAKILLMTVNDLMDFSSEVEIKRCEFSLRKLMDQTLMTFLPFAKEKGIVLEADIAVEVPERIVSDPERLKQLLFHLIDKSLKSIYVENVQIMVKVESEKILKFVISDSGEEEQFELTVLNKIVEKMGGKTSSTEDNRFAFTIGVEMVESSRVTANIFTDRTALVMESNESSGQAISKLLSYWGIETKVCRQFWDGLAILKDSNEKLDLIVTSAKSFNLDEAVFIEKIRDIPQARNIPMAMIGGGLAVKAQNIQMVEAPLSEEKLLDAMSKLLEE